MIEGSEDTNEVSLSPDGVNKWAKGSCRHGEPRLGSHYDTKQPLDISLNTTGSIDTENIDDTSREARRSAQKVAKVGYLPFSGTLRMDLTSRHIIAQNAPADTNSPTLGVLTPHRLTA